MLKKNHFLFLVIALINFNKVTAQVIYNKDAWSFELDKGVHYKQGYSDIVTTWTQEPGFILSSDFAHSGDYSCKMDFKEYKKSGKLQTWRSQYGKEGDIRILSDQSYSVTAWFYVPSGVPSGALSISMEVTGGKRVAANLNLKNIRVGRWTRVTAEFNAHPSVVRGLWSSISYFSKPNSDITVYVDDITFFKTNKLEFD